MSDQTTAAATSLNTTLLMTASAGGMGLLGFGALLFSTELIVALGGTVSGSTVALVEVAGALYVGFAMTNWMAREKLIGGIYSRPVALGNFAHFFGGAIVLVKHVIGSPFPRVHGAVAGVYALCAAGFGWVLFAGGDSCG